jgi:hypothetical protein
MFLLAYIGAPPTVTGAGIAIAAVATPATLAVASMIEARMVLFMKKSFNVAR